METTFENGSAQARGGNRDQQGNTWHQQSSSSSSCGSSGRKDMTYYATLEEQINLQAKKLTVDYLRKSKGENNNNNKGGDDTLDGEKIFIVYKFVNTPIDALI